MLHSPPSTYGLIMMCKTKMTFVATLAVVTFYIAAPVIGQVEYINSDLNSAGRNFSCSNEVVTYTCRGQGGTLFVDSPPLFNHPFGSTGPVPNAQVFPSAPNVVLNLINRFTNLSGTYYDVSLQIGVSSDVRINVSCSTDVPGPLNDFVLPLIHESRVEPPSDVRSFYTVKCAELIASRSVRVWWTPPANSQFDIDYYLVRVYRNRVLYTTITSTNNSLNVSIPFGAISADVRSVSTCGTISAAGASTDESVNEGCPEFYFGFLVPTLIGFLLIVTVIILVMFLVIAKRKISLLQVNDEKGEALEPHRQSSQ
ncbi:uncharacterized protein LOC135349323 [Halichondria panicea]|uniref:uncharacterized protein LOC135349323 n=1 Tax=Halichondria panicea TaxID=6063 RepID=UPI00312B9528